MSTSVVKSFISIMNADQVKYSTSNKKVADNVKPATCPQYTSKRTSALKKVARTLDVGGVCAVPTDTVYALAASCKHPESIEKLYKIKGRPSEKPICLCLSSLDQLKGTNPNFSPLLWSFMNKCYPGGISCVVPKGDWLNNLGLEDAVEFIGTHDSVCIRVPDSTVLSHLITMTGPLGITSANPSGEADSTHHDMVINSLGHKIDGVICDGPSNETEASTVVNCLKIDEGVISFFRVGCTPKEKVEGYFEEAKMENNGKIANSHKNAKPATCPQYTSKRTSALKKVAKTLDVGGVCAVPTDTVYALAASCKHPESIEKLYKIKGRPSEKPICLCLSSLDQLKATNPNFSPLLWSFMNKCYPGGISCVVPKGDWLNKLGLDDAVEFIGTRDSVCIRVPDSTVLSHLITMTGPLGITSANPSGEADSVHHDMVISSLGHKIDGVICDGPSNEIEASTVVNCLKIDEGVISFFRVGCTPKEKVEGYFEEAKMEHNGKIANSHENVTRSRSKTLLRSLSRTLY